MVCCNIDRLLWVRRKNCLGFNCRESGHRREPEPPAKITGNNMKASFDRGSEIGTGVLVYTWAVAQLIERPPAVVPMLLGGRFQNQVLGKGQAITQHHIEGVRTAP